MLYLCALSNIKSGSCSEDCRFCTQSSRWGAQIPRYRWKSAEVVLEEVEGAVAAGATGFCLVTSGKGITPPLLERVEQLISEIKSRYRWLKLIGCFGVATRSQLERLKRAGLEAYNHNLESSRGFFRNLTTTHRWEERFQTCLNVKEAGLELYAGGIFGVGEGRSHWRSLIGSLKLLEPEVIPVNFFIPNRALPLTPTHSFQQGLELLRLFRDHFPESVIMLAGGREYLFRDRWVEGIKAGANGIIIGNYLTTAGAPAHRDWEVIRRHRLPVYRPPGAPPVSPELTGVESWGETGKGGDYALR